MLVVGTTVYVHRQKCRYYTAAASSGACSDPPTSTELAAEPEPEMFDPAVGAGADGALTLQPAVLRALDCKPTVAPPARPTVVVSWGGIGAGKSTAAALLFAELPMAQSDCVLVGVDDLVELVPEYRAAVESGDPAQKEAAYMQYRGQGKALKASVIAAAVARRCNLYVEWTFEGNLQDFAAASEKAEVAYEAEGYDVVLMLISCHDLAGIQANAAKRERTIPPATIEKFNLDRTKHFVEAVNKIKLERPRCNLRAIVVERKDANAAGVLTDVTSALPFAAPEEGWTEASARTAVQLSVAREGSPDESGASGDADEARAGAKKAAEQQPQLRVRFHIIRNARIENVGTSQSCMVSKLRIIWKQTVENRAPMAVE